MENIKQWLLCLILAVVHEIGRAADICPADVETVLTRNGLPFVGRALLDKVINMSSSSQFAYEGSFAFESKKTSMKAQLSDLKVHEVNIPKPILALKPEDLKFSVSKMSFKMEFGWAGATFRDLPITNKSGRFSILANDVEVVVGVKMSNVQPSMPVTCSAKMHDYSLVSGNSELFTLYSRSIRVDIENMICEEAKKSFDVSQITSILTLINFSNNTLKDSVVKSQFVLGEDAIRTYHNLTGNVDTQVIAMNVPDDRMFGVGISERVINEVLKRKDWSKGKRPRLLGCWEELSRAFKLGWTEANAPFALNIDFHAPPSYSIRPDGFFVNLFGTLVVESVDSSTERALKPLILNFNCTLIFGLSLTSDGKKLKMKFEAVHFFDTTDEVDYSKLNNLVKYLFENYLKPSKVILIPLPLIDGVELDKPKLSGHVGYATLTSDVE